jgi:hypothetical protein
LLSESWIDRRVVTVVRVIEEGRSGTDGCGMGERWRNGAMSVVSKASPGTTVGVGELAGDVDWLSGLISSVAFDSERILGLEKEILKRNFEVGGLCSIF